jgi:hypothetical protein
METPNCKVRMTATGFALPGIVVAAPAREENVA